jgi:hypothetical protein
VQKLKLAILSLSILCFTIPPGFTQQVPDSSSKQQTATIDSSKQNQPQQNVYVHLKARMAELDRARAGGFALENSPGPDDFLFQDRTVTTQEALNYALRREAKYDGVVILGQPGSGKTTLAKYFLLCFATDKAKQNLQLSKKFLPILLFLRDVNPEKSLLENILASLQKHDLDLSEDFFRPFLEKGQAILLLDGLDEVPSDDRRATVSRWIHDKVHLTFPRCLVIVTSRFSGYRGEAVLKGHYLRLEIQDYGLEQVQQFLENWLTAVETHLFEDNKHYRTEAKNRAADLVGRIKKTPALHDLAVNPLMLQIIALVHRDRNTLPERRVELYKECTDVMLERWDKAKGMEVLLSANQARQLLQPVALWMHSVENRREVSKSELVEFISPIVPRIKREVDIDDLLKSWVVRSGIFKGEGETYFFHHLSFQEYLTAEEIRNKRTFDILVKNFDRGWWREPTLLAMGLTNPPVFADFMAKLLREYRKDGAGTDFMLRCIDEAMDKVETPFLDAMQKLRRFEAHYLALLALEKIGTEAAKEGVRNALKNKDGRLASHARSILAKAKGIEGLLEYVSGDPAQWQGKLRSYFHDDKRFNSDDQPVAGVAWFAASWSCSQTLFGNTLVFETPFHLEDTKGELFLDLRRTLFK